ncbi:hypothetical protein QQS21_008332 [Conoideocrella luteorostrata]|uniref:BTB domain-containing protein n=1 Tax=Conoideocrella luteorostrata TaxID=1105319 RepID=A0AAJ0CLF3_9HYPO|nr:hypothetical protein QQS21_008332 [Conoideocrella luteorostrata]
MVSQPDQPLSASTTALNLTNPSRRAHHQHQQHQYSASVISRPTSSRTKRYNGSHVGGASYLPQNEFPVFMHSGDVEIIIRVGGTGADAAEKRYLLHRHTLTRCSGFFEASTSSEWSKARPLLAGGNELARIGEEPSATLDNAEMDRFAVGAVNGSGAASPRRRWKYELDPGAGDGDIPMLVQKDDTPAGDSHLSFPSLFGSVSGPLDTYPKSSSRSKNSPRTTNHVSFSRSVANLAISTRLSQADEDLLRNYDNLFRIFYNYPPMLDGVNVADAYVQCKSLLALADQYDALGVVGPRVDHHLLQFQSRLWKQIAKYPISYLRLGYLARSKVIFQEALIHVVGQWPVGERSLRAALPDIVLDIIEDKVDELEEIVSRVEGRLFRLNLTTSKGERVTPSNNYLDWLVVSLFRQWLADNTTPQPTPERNGSNRGGGGGHSSSNNSNNHSALPASVPQLTSMGRAYRAIGSGSPSAFLNHDECKKFLKLTPELYSRDNLRRFEKRMDELKSMARGLVRPLLGSGLELDMAGTSRTSDGISYLTCTAVGNRDLPWPVDG